MLFGNLYAFVSSIYLSNLRTRNEFTDLLFNVCSHYNIWLSQGRGREPFHDTKNIGFFLSLMLEFCDFELQYSFDSSDNIWIKSVGFR